MLPRLFGRLRPAVRSALFVVPLAVGGAAVAETPTAVPAAETAPAPRRPGETAAPSPAVELDHKIIAEAKDHSQIMANLLYLSDTIGPRLTGSANLERANNWAADKMKAYGLTNVHLEPWEIPVGWERGPATMKLVEPNNGRHLMIAAAGWSPGTKGKVTGPVVVLNARTKEDLEKYKGKLKNAVIIRTPPATVAPIADNASYLNDGPKKGKLDPKKEEPRKDEKAEAKKADDAKKDAPKKDEPAQPPRRPGGGAGGFGEMQALQRELDEMMRSEGAAAVLSDSAKPHSLLVTTGSWREGDRATQQEPLPRLFVAHEHYATLYRLATTAAKDGTKPPMVELEVTNKFIPGPITVFNTVGDIVGSEKPDEIMVVGAHLDSWDLASGTTDNGTGSCVTLEVARVLSEMAKQGNRPKRTIRFVLFTGEEEGLHGSRKYVERHKDEMDKHTAALVHDTGTGKVKNIGLLNRPQVQKILETELATLKEVKGWEGVNPAGMAGGTDHQSFNRVGVPGFACGQDPDEYRLTHHTQSDTFDKAKEENLIEGATVIAVIAERIANLPEKLPRERGGDAPGGPGGGGGKGGRKKDGKKDDKADDKKGPDKN